MSEEILKALMQLFAIISKQDEGTTDNQRLYVESFLSSQLNKDKVDEYFDLYNDRSSAEKDKQKNKARGKDAMRTAMKDSVRTLALCRKINKTLSQKQKVIVLLRIFELLKAEQLYTDQRMGIIETISTVFNVSKEELQLINNFSRYDDRQRLDHEMILAICSDADQKQEYEKAKSIITDSLDGTIYFLKIRSVDLYFMKYTGRSEITLNGLSFNNKSIFIFPSGSTLRLPKGTIYYSDIISKYIKDENVSRIVFSAEDISYKFPGNNYGLRNVHLNEEFGLIGIMGASGSGKTTLLNVLSGVEKPLTGKVTINGIDVHEDSRESKALIGYIAQDDFLFEDLTVYQNLYYSTMLCYRNKAKEEIVERVNKALISLGLYDIKDIRVGSPLNKKISGGQRKRLNIALELIREPSVLFVDEPTSGLSSKDSENVMDLLKELSLNMKLIFVVIHQPSSDIFKMFDRIFVLDTGGYPIYYNNPVESLVYFKSAANQINADAGECRLCGNVNPEMLFNIIEAKEVDDFGRFTRSRIKSPEDWHELFISEYKPRIIEELAGVEEKVLNIPSKMRQFAIYLKRDILSKVKNKQYLLINLLETPLLAFLLTIIIKYSSGHDGVYVFGQNENIPPYIFMSIVIALFVGLSVSAEEIFRDRKILKREAFLSLSRSSYLMSKIAILFVLSAYQSLVFVLIGNSILEIRGLFLEYWMVLFATAAFANLLGLIISSSFNSAVTIYILIPLLVIPQMVLGGAMFSFDKLNNLVGGDECKTPVIADMMVSRWAYEALAVTQFKDNPYDEYFYQLEKMESQINYKLAYYIPELEALLNNCEELLYTNDNDIAEQKYDDLYTLRNELDKESRIVNTGESLDMKLLMPANFDQRSVNELYEYIDALKEKYITTFNVINSRKNDYIEDIKNKMGKGEFLKLKEDNHNEFLASLVKKENVKNKLIIEKNSIQQIADPIFQDPDTDGNVLVSWRADFYSPAKNFFHLKLDTLYFNLGVIWFFSVLCYIFLYFDVLRRVFNLFEVIAVNKKRIKS